VSASSAQFNRNYTVESFKSPGGVLRKGSGENVQMTHTQARSSERSAAFRSSARRRADTLIRLARAVSPRAPRVSGPKAPPDPAVASVVEPAERAILDEVRGYTLTSEERVLATMDAVEYIARNDVPGALVECGVWRGGSVLAMIRTLQRFGVDDRDVYLFDTFEGMTAPSELDVSDYHEPAIDTWRRDQDAGKQSWDYFFDPSLYTLKSVQDLLLATGYPAARLHFVVGPVEETLPGKAPEQIAVLRLDTDWYESTKHELDHLYPLVAAGGVLILDDYGHWDGARRAVDEYFADLGTRPLLCRTDYTGRIGTKPSW
jgi:O-methyltransferase